MKKKLFGNNIDCSCDYCHNARILKDGSIYCKRNKSINNLGQCSYFDYNPLKREPRPRPKPRNYDPEDFML